MAPAAGFTLSPEAQVTWFYLRYRLKKQWDFNGIPKRQCLQGETEIRACARGYYVRVSVLPILQISMPAELFA